MESNSTLIRIDKDTKKILDDLIKENPQFKSYGEIMDFILQEKSTSKAQKLVKTFLEDKKGCSHFVTQLGIGRYKTDILAAKLKVGKKEQTEFGYLIENEVYLVEIKKDETEIIKGIGQLLLYRQLLQINCWMDSFYVYLAVEIDSENDIGTLGKEIKDLLNSYGIGLLKIEKANITIEFEAKDQTQISLAKIKQKSKFECNHCTSEYSLNGIQCLRCGGLLNLNLYDDLFKKTSINVTNQIRNIINSDSILKRIYPNADEVLSKLQKEIDLKKSQI